MISAADFYVFPKWKEASVGAFGIANVPAVVPDEDKEAYWRIYEELVAAAEAAVAKSSVEGMTVRPKAYSRARGSRGHRPVDLWVSVCGKDAKTFGHMPQVYAIASDRGLEVGFAASIPESDYFDIEAKLRNRSLVPLINARLPSPRSQVAQALETVLEAEGGWVFSTGTRKSPGDSGYNAFGSLSALLSSLKAKGEKTGGGAVARVYSLSRLEAVDIQREFERALAHFGPFLEAARPSAWDAGIVEGQAIVADLSPGDIFDPSSIEDGRRRVFAEVARRQGQAKFRNKLMTNYEGACAISGCDIADVLHAAHIFPYLGPDTNHPSNGLLLRADIHTLFDLGLIRIEPGTLKISVSSVLDQTDYEQYRGKTLRLPSSRASRPSIPALEKRWATYS